MMGELREIDTRPGPDDRRSICRSAIPSSRQSSPNPNRASRVCAASGIDVVVDQRHQPGKTAGRPDQFREVGHGLLASGRGQARELLFPERLDPRSRSVMWEIIRELAADGTTLLLTTQYLDEADQLADQIVVVDAGRVIAAGTSGQLKVKAGDDQLVLALAPGADPAAAAAVVKGYATGPVLLDDARLRLHLGRRGDCLGGATTGRSDERL